MAVLRFPLLAGIAGLLLSACSSTQVILLPDPSGKVGQVSVATEGGEQTLSKAGESTRVSDQAKAPAIPEVLSEEEIERRFAETLNSEPEPPSHYLLYFRFDSDEPRADSVGQLPAIQTEIEKRGSCDIAVIGHTDRMGNETYNRRLSLRRANNIRRWLINHGISAGCLRVVYYGESDPKVRTADGKSEPRNRRVEVEIR